MQLNKFTNSIEDPLHTNGFAAAARNSGGAGVTGPQSFDRRLHVERNRRNVNRYHDSMIANGHHRERGYQRLDIGSPARPGMESESGVESPNGRQSSGRLISDVVRPAMRPNFSDPPTRGYNPYK